MHYYHSCNDSERSERVDIRLHQLFIRDEGVSIKLSSVDDDFVTHCDVGRPKMAIFLRLSDLHGMIR